MRLLLRGAGVCLLAGLTLPCGLVMLNGCSAWTALQLLALAAVGVALAAPGPRKQVVAAVALGALGAGALARLAVTSTNPRLAVRAAGGARIVDALLDEEDLARAATRLLRFTGFGRDPDLLVLDEAMRDGYARLRADVGTVASPVVATALGLQSPRAFDTIALGDPRAPTTLIFLHGFTGSFALPCWQLAHAVRTLRVRTLCPATGFRGDWWSAEGEATLRAVVASERARGAQHLVLAGLSNGGVGACWLAARLPGGLDGLVLISGADPAAPPVSAPTLVLSGTGDAVFPVEALRAYAARTGAERVELPAGHFALLVEHERAEAAIGDFVARVTRDDVPGRPAP